MKAAGPITGAVLLSLAIPLSSIPMTAHADEILVSAAASLTDVLKGIGTGYQAKSKHTLTFNFGCRAEPRPATRPGGSRAPEAARRR